MTHFTQWVADNVDHDMRTLTGMGTFHGMGIIVITSSKLKCKVIQRLKHNTMKDLSIASVKIRPYDGSSYYGLLQLRFKPIKDLTLKNVHEPEMNLDLVCHGAWLFSLKNNNHRSNWSGYMIHATSKVTTIYEAASVKFLLIIDVNPLDETCLFNAIFCNRTSQEAQYPHILHNLRSAFMEERDGNHQGEKSTNGLSIKRISHNNERSRKYWQSNEWFWFGGSP